jgi:hypothetical protein
MSPTARSLAHLRELGYRCEVVEKTIPRTFIKKDLWGADIVAVRAGSPLLAVQATTGAHVSARIQKLQVLGFIELWKSAGASIEVWGWKKQGPRGKRKTWTVRRESL